MRVAYLVPFLLAASACSSGSQPLATPSATPSPSPSVVATTAAPTPTPTVSPTPAPTTAAPTRPPAADGDVDGDGTPDAVKATADLITVTLSKSGSKVTAPVHTDGPAAPEVLGSKDVDRDGHAEIFLKTVQGASTGFATPYRYDGKVLRELRLAGEPALLGFGGSTQHGDGFTCTQAGLIQVRSATADGTGSTYTVKVDTYRLTATDLVKAKPQTVSQAKQGSPEVEAAYALDCGSVGEGG